MGDLLTAEPIEVASLALRLRRAAAAVAEVRPTDRPLAWRGQAAEAFAARLRSVRTRLPHIEQCYGDASRVVLSYAGALEEAQVLCRRATELRVEADRLTTMSALPGPDPGDALRMTAARWEGQARERHHAAARRAAAELDVLADAAPRARRGAGRDRFWSDVGSSLWSQVTGTAHLVVTGDAAIDGNRAARDELAAVARESWRVWEPVVELYEQVADDRGGLAFGAIIGAGASKGIHLVHAPKPSTKHLVHDIDLARSEALQEGRVRRLIDLLGVDRRPYRGGDTGLALFVHEAMNGHAIRQHVAKSLAYLRWRADQPKLGSASSFATVKHAQALLDELVRRHPGKMRDLLAMEMGDYDFIITSFDEVVGHGYAKGDAALRSTTEVYAGFERVPGGLVLVSFYPKVV